MFSSPKTTIWGICIAIGTALVNINSSGELGWLHWLGQILIAVGSLMLGISAKDS